MLYSHINRALLMNTISKTEFKARALEILRDIEQSNQPRVITDRGRPTLEIRKLKQYEMDPLKLLKGTVLKYDAATAPVMDHDSEHV